MSGGAGQQSSSSPSGSDGRSPLGLSSLLSRGDLAREGDLAGPASSDGGGRSTSSFVGGGGGGTNGSEGSSGAGCSSYLSGLLHSSSLQSSAAAGGASSSLQSFSAASFSTTAATGPLHRSLADGSSGSASSAPLGLSLTKHSFPPKPATSSSTTTSSSSARQVSSGSSGSTDSTSASSSALSLPSSSSSSFGGALVGSNIGGGTLGQQHDHLFNNKRKRPKKPTAAYNYYFKDQCRQLVREGKYNDYCGSSSSHPQHPHDLSAAKRRKSDSGEAIPLQDMGKTIAFRWRELSTTEKARYEAMAERDAERYREEIEEYYRNTSEVTAAVMAQGRSMGGDSSTSRVSGIGGAIAGAVPAAQANGGGGNGEQRSQGMFPRAITPTVSACNLSAGGSGTGGAGAGSSSKDRLLVGKSPLSFSATPTGGGAATSAASSSSSALTTATGLGGNHQQQLASMSRKTDLQKRLAMRRSELLSDITSLNEITSSRIAAGKPAFKKDAAQMQRLYNLAVGPAGGSNSSSMFSNGRLGLTNGSGAGAASSTSGMGGIAGLGASGIGSTFSASGAAGTGRPAFGTLSSGAGSSSSTFPITFHRRRSSAMSTASTVTIELLDPTPPSSRSNSFMLPKMSTSGSNGSALAAAMQAKLGPGSSRSSSGAPPGN